MERRRFILCTLGSAGLGYLGCKASNQIGVTSGSGRLIKCSRSTRALGSQVHCTVYSPDMEAAENAIASAFAEIERVESLMSLYRADSQLSRLNRQGYLDRPDPDLHSVLSQAMGLSQRSEGAFDVTVQPLWELYQHCKEAGITPAPEEIRRTCQSVGWQRIRMTGQRIELQPGTRITLNGIAQGYAADVACEALRSQGVTSAILDTGEVGLIGQHHRKDHWTVGIKHPRQPGALLGSAHLRNRSLATSGDYETRFSNDYRFHHLFDPQTGTSAEECSSVSVVAPTTMQADALSTACFVLGLRRGMELVRSTPDTDALFVTKNGQTHQSPGFPLGSFEEA
jgi:thiamine biosynthesis lipoprotein